MAHELVHTHQYERHGSLTGFLRTYLLQCLRHGYAYSALERSRVQIRQPLTNPHRPVSRLTAPS